MKVEILFNAFQNFLQDVVCPKESVLFSTIATVSFYLASVSSFRIIWVRWLMFGGGTALVIVVEVLSTKGLWHEESRKTSKFVLILFCRTCVHFKLDGDKDSSRKELTIERSHSSEDEYSSLIIVLRISSSTHFVPWSIFFPFGVFLSFFTHTWVNCRLSFIYVSSLELSTVPGTLCHNVW